MIQSGLMGNYKKDNSSEIIRNKNDKEHYHPSHDNPGFTKEESEAQRG